MNKTSFSFIVVTFSQSLCYSADISDIVNERDRSSSIAGRVIDLEEYKPIRQEIRGYCYAINNNYYSIFDLLEKSNIPEFFIDRIIYLLDYISNNFASYVGEYQAFNDARLPKMTLAQIVDGAVYSYEGRDNQELSNKILDIIVPFVDKWKDYRPAKFRNNKSD